MLLLFLHLPGVSPQVPELWLSRNIWLFGLELLASPGYRGVRKSEFLLLFGFYSRRYAFFSFSFLFLVSCDTHKLRWMPWYWVTKEWQTLEDLWLRRRGPVFWYKIGDCVHSLDFATDLFGQVIKPLWAIKCPLLRWGIEVGKLISNNTCFIYSLNKHWLSAFMFWHHRRE